MPEPLGPRPTSHRAPTRSDRVDYFSQLYPEPATHPYQRFARNNYGRGWANQLEALRELGRGELEARGVRGPHRALWLDLGHLARAACADCGWLGGTSGTDPGARTIEHGRWEGPELLLRLRVQRELAPARLPSPEEVDVTVVTA